MMKFSQVISATLLLMIIIVLFNTDVVSYDLSLDYTSDKEDVLIGKVLEFPLSICYIDAQISLDDEVYVAKSYQKNPTTTNHQTTSYTIAFKEKMLLDVVYNVIAVVTEDLDRSVLNIEVTVEKTNTRNNQVESKRKLYQLD